MALPRPLAGRTFALVNVNDAKAPNGSVGFELQDVQIAEGRVRVATLGTGRPALFLHGVSAHGRSWRAAAQSLYASHPGWACWLPDLLGRGASDARPDCHYTLHDEVRRIREIVHELTARAGHAVPFPPLIVGHSQGAAIALALTRAEPSIRGLVLSNPVTSDIRRPRALSALESAAARAAIARLFAPLHRPLGRLILRRAGGPHFRVPSASIEAYAKPYRDPVRARTLMRILADWRPSDLSVQMPSRRLKAHVVAGACDPRVPVHLAERLSRQLDCEFTLIADGGHILPEQHPARLGQVVSEMVEQIRASEA